MENKTQLPNTIVKLLDKQKKIRYIRKGKILKTISIIFVSLVVLTLVIIASLFFGGVIFNG